MKPAPDNNQLSFYVVAAGVAGQVGCMLVLVIGVALGLGLFLDQALGTKPILLLLLLLGSIPLNLWLIYRYILYRARRLQATMTQKEDTTSGN